MHYYDSGPLHRAVQVRRQECWASECNCKPSRSWFFFVFVWVASATSLCEHHNQKKTPLKIEKIKKNKKNKIQQLLVPGLRDARLEVELWFRDVSPSLPPLPAAPSRHSASQSDSGWVRRPRCSPPLSNIIGHIPGLALLENKDGPRWAHTNWAMCSKGLKKKKKSWGYPGSGLQ